MIPPSRVTPRLLEPRMNEEEWFSETDFTRHLSFMAKRLSFRKDRLLAAAFCRAVLHYHSETNLHPAVDMAEEFADGNCTIHDLESHRLECRETAVRARERWEQLEATSPYDALNWLILSELAWVAAFTATSPVPLEQISQIASEVAMRARTGDSGVIRAQLTSTPIMMAEQNLEFRSLVWEVAGNPFSALAFESDWRTGTTTALARGMYQSRDFSAMPILADALQDAGCDDEEVLRHCRQPGVHVRGCWVVDQVLDLK